jgi:multiple sugar transport system substrate-binding protein
VASLPQALHKIIQITITLVLVLPAVGLLAFGPRGIDHPPRNKVIVDYWEKWTGSEGNALNEIVDDFNKSVGAQKGIFVRCVTTSSVEQKTLVATAAGVPPDIAGLYDWNVPEYAARDALEPLDDLAAEHGITASTFKKVFWNLCHYDGHLYALTSTGYDYALYLNTREMREAGIDPAKPPRSIAELDAYSRKMEQIGPSGQIRVAGYMPFEPGWALNYTPYWFGASWWDAKHRKFRFTDPQVVKAFEWVQSYPKRLGAGPVATYCSGVGNYDSPQNAFLAQTIAMEQQGTFFANFIQSEAPALAGNWEVSAFPSDNPTLKDVTYCSSDVLVIPRGSRHKREAFEFMAYVARQDVMEKLSNAHCKISALAQVSETFLSHHRNPFIRVFERLADSPNARSAPLVPIMPEINEEMTNFVDRLRLLQVTPEEGLRQVQSRLQAKYDDFMNEQRLRALRH